MEKAPPRIRRHATFVVALAGFLAVSATICVATVIATHGTLTYVLDDTYIHLTMARNFADYLSWGMVPHVFEASSSSPGWVLLLAGFFKLFEPLGEWWPLVINATAAVGIIAIFAWKQDVVVIREYSPLSIAAVFILPSVLFLPALLLVGMEHTLHSLVILLLFLHVERLLQERRRFRDLGIYALLLLVATALRFESACLALGFGIVLLAPSAAAFTKRAISFRQLFSYRMAAFAISGAAPLLVIATVGVIDLAHGRYFLPNSIIEKSALLSSGNGVTAFIPNPGIIGNRLFSDQLLVALVVAAVIAIWAKTGLRQLWVAWLIATLLHCAYAQVGWFDRYQAYLLISGLYLALRTLPELEFLSSRVRGLVIVLLLTLLPLYKFTLIAAAPAWALSQYQVQNQVGRFMAAYYQGQTVMTEDIGHVTWEHSQGGLLDMWALADFDVLKSQRGGYWNADYMTTLARQDNVAILAEYTPEFDFLVPHGFVKVAVWPLPDPQAHVAEAIVFWAPDPHSAAVMRAQMQQFIPTLPPGDSGYLAT